MVEDVPLMMMIQWSVTRASNVLPELGCTSSIQRRGSCLGKPRADTARAVVRCGADMLLTDPPPDADYGGRMGTKTSTKWTAEDDRRLLELKAAGKSYSLIAAALKRTGGSVKTRVRLLKLGAGLVERALPSQEK
jgi:hypothetical protein